MIFSSCKINSISLNQQSNFKIINNLNVLMYKKDSDKINKISTLQKLF